MLRAHPKSVTITIGDDSFSAEGFSRWEEIADLFEKWLEARAPADPHLDALADQLDSQQHDLERAVNAAKETTHGT